MTIDAFVQLLQEKGVSSDRIIIALGDAEKATAAAIYGILSASLSEREWEELEASEKTEEEIHQHLSEIYLQKSGQSVDVLTTKMLELLLDQLARDMTKIDISL